MIVNALSVLLPETWIDSVLAWCGLAPIPDSVLFRYLMRGSGYMLISFGVLIWIAASDVMRYKPIVIAVVTVFLVGAPVSYSIATLVGLPFWLRVLDASICILSGGVPLLFCMLPAKKSSNQVGPANGSQPIRSETNSTSSAAGSDR